MSTSIGERVSLDEPEPGIAVVRFSNPPSGLMDEATEHELTALLDAITSRSDLRVVILTGADEGVFVRHYDVGILERRARAMAARSLHFTLERPVPERPLHTCLRRMEESPLPFVAAINGTAMGGGFELALACDLRLAEEGDYPIGLPEVRLGLLPGAGGTQRLAATVGRARALELVLTGATPSPARAAELGLVDRCVAAPVLDAALDLARQIASVPPRAVAHIKFLLRRTVDEGALAAERTLFCDLMVRPEAIEIMARMNAGDRDIRDP